MLCPLETSLQQLAMTSALTLILVCQLIGEVLVSSLSLSVPGPVVGMLLLFCYLMYHGGIPETVGHTADTLLKAMSLLFVPAGAGVILHFQLLGDALLPLSAALVISTAITIVITAWVMRLLDRHAEPDQPSANGQDI